MGAISKPSPRLSCHSLTIQPEQAAADWVHHRVPPACSADRPCGLKTEKLPCRRSSGERESQARVGAPCQRQQSRWPSYLAGQSLGLPFRAYAVVKRTVTTRPLRLSALCERERSHGLSRRNLVRDSSTEWWEKQTNSPRPLCDGATAVSVGCPASSVIVDRLPSRFSKVRASSSVTSTNSRRPTKLVSCMTSTVLFANLNVE